MKTLLAGIPLFLFCALGLAPAAAAQVTPAGNPGIGLELHLASAKPVEAVTLVDMQDRPVFEGRPEGDKIYIPNLAPGKYVALLKIGHRIVMRKVQVGRGLQQGPAVALEQAPARP